MARRSTARVRDDIAIIGMNGRFPGARNLDEFWSNLQDGVESITSFSPSDLEASGVDPLAFENPRFVPAGSVIEDVDLFDAAFFGFSPREAESLDPQQRVFLEVAWHALEDTGYEPASFPGLIGVYGGCAMSTYLHHLQSNPEFMTMLGYLQVYIGNDKDYLTTHVSYKLNLRGPSFGVQTACSTSLLAVAVASDHLVSRQCDMALAGGVCVRIPQETGYYFEPGGIFSPDGHCRVFDERAAGVVFGNGVGIVVLKRLSDALADGDTIYAVVRGWAVNNDGAAKASYAAPSLRGQADVIARAQRRAGVSPDTITYIEAHGTGTSLGDPIEIAALTEAFRASTRRKNFCAVGSVKTNVGHLDPAAGVASLIKTVLALQHRQIPPSLNCETLNPTIDFANSPFYVNRQLTEWTAGRGPRRAGVSGFGIGGTNVHLVLEEAPALEPAEDNRPHNLLVLSARSGSALETTVSNLAEHLGENAGLGPADVAFTLQIGRKALNHRCAVVYHDLDDLVTALQAKDPRRLLMAEQAPQERSVAFMFSGQGSQYVNMASKLYRAEPTFRADLDVCSEILEPHLGLDVRTLLYPTPERAEGSSERLAQTQITQPALFAVEYSLARLWMEWGVRPDAMIGHSIGEYVAACLAGVFSLDDALALVAERGRLMQALPGGSMLAVPLPVSALQPFLEGELDLAATNEPNLCVASGPTAAVERLQGRLAEEGLACRRLHTSHAFHSRMMEPILATFAATVGKVALQRPRIPYVSNVTGDWINAAEATDPEYWARHLRRPVRFTEGLRPLLSEQDRILLEVGPGQSLSTFARRHPARTRGQLVLSSVRHPQEPHADTAFILDSLARLWLAGVHIDWSGLHAHERRRRLHLPGYPFERQRYWAELPGPPESPSPVILKEPDLADWFYVPSWEYAIVSEPTAPAASCWLVFEDDCGVARHVVGRLRREGHDVVTVRGGERYATTDAGAYEIRPGRRDDYVALFEDLREANRLPQNVLHLWSVAAADADESELQSFERHQDRCFYSLLYLAQALVKLRRSDPVQVVAASNGVHLVTGEEQLSPGRAPILGACKAIPQEYPNIMCRNVDVEVLAGDGRSCEAAAAQLLAEFSRDRVDSTIAYRRGQRWVQVFEPLRLDRLEESSASSLPLRQSGVYLITGGLGGIGLTLAEHLASTVGAKLVLVGRSTFPARDDWDAWLASHDPEDATTGKIRCLQSIEDRGAEVLIVSADVADAPQMRAALDQAYARFGSLHGVIHAAGNVTPSGFFGVDEADHEPCERQFRAKVRGLTVLAETLGDEQLDFVVLVSSISSVLAGLGYVAYAAANIFMDAFAQKCSQTSGVLWTSIDWDTWDLQATGAEEADPVQLSMSRDEGVEAFRRILSSAMLPQVVVSTGYLQDRIDQWIDLQSLREARERRERQSVRLHSRPELATSYMAPRSDLERAIAGIWQEMLGVAQVGIIDNFFTDLGGNSLLATQLISRLRDRFQVELPLRRFFEGPTVAELSTVIDSQGESEPPVAPGDDLLKHSDVVPSA